jgi:hypothetical protein
MLLTLSTVHMTVTTLHSFEASFLLCFIPVLLTNLSSCIWDMADMFYRITEPFASMSEPGPAAANLLLDYPSTAPVAITIKAIQNGHWRVALCSTFSLLATIPPIIVTSIFVGTPTPDGVAISIEPINFWVFYVLLIVYLVFMVILRPTPSYRLLELCGTFATFLATATQVPFWTTSAQVANLYSQPKRRMTKRFASNRKSILQRESTSSDSI